MMDKRLRSCAVAAVLVASLSAQEPSEVEARLQKLEAQNRELQRQLDAMSRDMERDSTATATTSSAARTVRGLGERAAKVYAVDQGATIGGYGETWFTQRSGRPDMADALRAILYVGYRFDDEWLVNTEIEIEHGSTADDAGEVSLEFGYLERMFADEFRLRAGVLLAPVGLVNELHEPTAFLPAARAQTEQRILPTTWREIGISAYGDVGDFSYRTALLTSLDGAEFGASGLRGGRQKAAKAEADDWMGFARLDYVAVPGVLVGGSAAIGNAGQDNLDGATRIPDLQTTIFDLHADCRFGPWTWRGLYAASWLEDAGEFSTATGASLAQRMEGYYVEFGCDVLSLFGLDSSASLTPFVRFERIDTQADMPSGFAADPSQRDRIWTFGLNYQPIPQVVVKLDYEAWDEDFNRCNLLLGYVF